MSIRSPLKKTMAENVTAASSGAHLVPASTAGEGETPTPIVGLSDADVSRLAAEVVTILDRRSRETPPTSSPAGPSTTAAPPGDTKAGSRHSAGKD